MFGLSSSPKVEELLLQIKADVIVKSQEHNRMDILENVMKTRAAIIQEIRDSETRYDGMRRRSQAESYLVHSLAFTEMNDRCDAVLEAHKTTSTASSATPPSMQNLGAILLIGSVMTMWTSTGSVAEQAAANQL